MPGAIGGLPVPNLSFQTKSGADGNVGGSTSVGRLITKEGISYNFGDGGSAGAVGNKSLIAAAIGGALVWMMMKKGS